jgi:hypothetical protein
MGPGNTLWEDQHHVTFHAVRLATEQLARDIKDIHVWYGSSSHGGTLCKEFIAICTHELNDRDNLVPFLQQFTEDAYKILLRHIALSGTHLRGMRSQVNVNQQV